MEKIVGMVILAIALMAIGNAALMYKRSLYFESSTRVNLKGIVENAETMEHSRLLELARRLVLISDSDFGILNILSDQFRRVILFLSASLFSALIYALYLLWRLKNCKERE